MTQSYVFKNITLFRSSNINESKNVVSLAYRLEICFLFIQLERDKIHNFVRVIGNALSSNKLGLHDETKQIIHLQNIHKNFNFRSLLQYANFE